MTTLKGLREECAAINERLPDAGKITSTIGIVVADNRYAVVEYTNEKKAYHPLGGFGTIAEASKILGGISFGLARCRR